VHERARVCVHAHAHAHVYAQLWCLPSPISHAKHGLAGVSVSTWTREACPGPVSQGNPRASTGVMPWTPQGSTTTLRTPGRERAPRVSTRSSITFFPSDDLCVCNKEFMRRNPGMQSACVIVMLAGHFTRVPRPSVH
jgi:hypothetical protein